MSMEQNKLELKINPNDISLDTKQIPKRKNAIRRTTAGLLTALTLFSGSIVGSTNVHAQEIPNENTTTMESTVDDLNADQVVDIPDEYKDDVAYLCGKDKTEDITIADLAGVQTSFLSLPINNDASLEWLNYLHGVDYLAIIHHAENTNMFNDIKKIPDVKSISISSLQVPEKTMTKEDFKFLKDSTTLTELSIYGYNIEPGLLEELTNLKTLSLTADYGNCAVDFSKLTFLDNLDFKNTGPYDIAVNFTEDEYKALKSAGVNIEFDEPESEIVYQDINNKLNSIIETIGVNKDSSDEEKLNAILVYVLDNLNYDSDVSYMSNNNNRGDEFKDRISSFYEGGYLYGALEKDSAICGNYAALTNALAERLDLNNTVLLSEDHAWSLLEIEDELYYVDATWLENCGVFKEKTETQDFGNGQIGTTTYFESISGAEAIKEGRGKELDWYMANPIDYPKNSTHPESHEAINIPEYLKIKLIEEETKDISNTLNNNSEETNFQETEQDDPTKTDTAKAEIIKVNDKDRFEISLGNKKWLVPAGAAVGVMMGLGGAIAIGHKKKSNKRRKQTHSQYQNSYRPYGSNNSITTDLDDMFSGVNQNSYSSGKHHRGRKK